MSLRHFGSMDHYDLLGFLIITLNCNVTIVGKIWLIFMILLRMVVIIVAGSPVYQDEQERFVCNTLQPGCTNVCYDIFSPVSHLRFCLVQSISVFLPFAVFSVYVLHKGAELAGRDCCGPDGGPEGQHPTDPSTGGRRCPLPCRDGRRLAVPDFSFGYIVHLCLRTLAETAFGALQYLLFGFSVPNSFSCAHSPCSGAVDCYVSRPTEKSALMLLLWTLSAVSELLSVVDLLCSLHRRTRRRPSPAEGRSDRRPGSAARDRGGEERAELAHPVPRPQEHCAQGPRGQLAELGRMELPDEDESEGLALSGDKLPRACTEPGSSSCTEAPQSPRSDRTVMLRCLTARRCSSSPRQPAARRAGAGSAPVLGTSRSEWV